METTRKTRSGVPYFYKVNNKKRAIGVREGLESDEEEVEDLRAVEQIEEILRATYEKKTRGPRAGERRQQSYPYQCQCGTHKPMLTNTPKRTIPFR